MRINILIAGKAGQGINGVATILSEALVKAGFYVFNYRSYQSLITGGHNFNVLCVSDEEVLSFDKDYDAALLLDERSLDEHKFKENCVRLCNFDCEKGINLKGDEFKKVQNIFMAGALFKILGLDKKFLMEVIEEKFKGKSLLELDLKAVEESYSQDYKKELKIKAKDKVEKRYMEGAEATGLGAIEGGLDVYLAYPMTPSTSLLVYLAQNKEGKNYVTFEPESEIAVANVALGSSFAGARTMIGTSGGGFDLMTEAISMQGMTELPLVVYLAQRNGPSSGAATYTGQQDLNLALNAGHGYFPRVVVAPGDIQESYKTAKEAIYLSEKYKLLVMYMTDKHLAESGFTQKMKHYDLFIGKKGKYPGKGLVRANSYTHDENGNYTEEAETIKKMTDKRNKKLEEAKKEMEEKFEMFKTYGDKESKKLVIGWGSTKGAILEGLPEGYKFIHVIYVEPFTEELKKEIKEAEEVKVVEVNSTGQLADVIQKKTGRMIPKENRILKYDGRPFTPERVKERLK